MKKINNRSKGLRLNKVEDFNKVKLSAKSVSEGLSVLRYMEVQIELSYQKSIESEEFQGILQRTADMAKHAKSVKIERLLKDNDSVRKYLLSLKEDSSQH